MLKGEIITINAYIENQERSQINNPTLQFKILAKENTKPKASIFCLLAILGRPHKVPRAVVTTAASLGCWIKSKIENLNKI